MVAINGDTRIDKVISSATNEAGSLIAMPVGSVVYFPSLTLPAGYLKANGAAISRSTYASLFAVIGITYGSGDGSTTFNLPDLRGEFIRRYDDGRNVDSGRVLGSAQAESLKSHNHNMNIAIVGVAAGGTGIEKPSTSNNPIGGIVNDSGGTETRPRNIALVACIKY